MAFTVVAYREALTPAAALVNVAAVADQHVFTSGDDIRIPDTFKGIVGAYVLCPTPVTVAEARLESPSLRSVFNYHVSPVGITAVAVNAMQLMLHPRILVPLMPAEALQLLIRSTGGGTTHFGLVYLADGPLTPVEGDIRTVTATSVTASVDLTWSNGPLTFVQTLPVGRYQVVGMRGVQSVIAAATQVAMRLVFPGGLWRPGVPVHLTNDAPDGDAWALRRGQMGVWGEFHTNAPPTLDVIGGTSATHTVFLDLIRIG